MSSFPVVAATDSTTVGPCTSGERSLQEWLTAALNRLGLLSIHLRNKSKSVGAATLASVWTLLACKLIIGVVSALDTYLTIKYAISLDVYEQNPLGRWLMGLDHGPVAETQQIAAFITAKFVGTLLVMIVIQGLAYWRLRVAGLVAVPVALGQLYLLMHLMFADG